jgi:hypothetical protein
VFQARGGKVELKEKVGGKRCVDKPVYGFQGAFLLGAKREDKRGENNGDHYYGQD